MRRAFVALAFLAFAHHAPAADPKPLEFKLTFDKAACDVPFAGRVYVAIRAGSASPPVGMNWFKPEPGLARDVKNWEPGTPLFVGAKDVAYPAPLADLKPGKYYVAAVMDRDLGGIDFLASPGNVFAKTVQLDLDPKSSGTVELKLDQVVKPREFKETDTVKLVEIESKLLTNFHGKPTSVRAGVVLPPSFAKEPDRKYPVVYEITGFGGNHFAAFNSAARKAWDVNGTEMIWVVLDANCRLGHHVFADSANNGPVGTALVTELIPHLEKAYRGSGVRLHHGALVGRVEQPVVAGDVPGHVRGVLVHCAGPGRFPRLPTDRHLREGRERVHRRRGQDPPARAHERQAGAVLQAVLGDGRPHEPRRATRLVRGGVQPEGRRRPPAETMGPQDRRH